MKYILTATVASAAFVALAHPESAPRSSVTAEARTEVLSTETPEAEAPQIVQVAGLDAPARLLSVELGADGKVRRYVVETAGRELKLASYRVAFSED